MGDLRAGRRTLACGAACRGVWDAEQGSLIRLDRAERWSDLGLRVMQTGYGSDLAYYYLGQAAEGMGYYQAAVGYYTQARAVADSSDTAMQCAGGDAHLDRCEGIRIDDAVPALIADCRAAMLLDIALNAPPQAPVHRRAKIRAVASGSAGSGEMDAAKTAKSQGVAGPAQAIDTATLQIHGRTVSLAGIAGKSEAYAAQLQALIDAQGATVRCTRYGAGFTCTLPNGLDVGRAALSSGIATAAPDAPADYRDVEETARAAHRGVWE